ncbi:MAG: hypothetical protein AB7D43_06595 [Sulfurimonadaceae bacterium]
MLKRLFIISNRLRSVAASCLFAAVVVSGASLEVPQNIQNVYDAVQHNVAGTPDQRLWLSIDEVKVIDHGTSMSWYATTINQGGRIAKDQLEVRAYQMIGGRILGEAGSAITSTLASQKGDMRVFTRQNWERLGGATQLKVIVFNKKNNASVSKTINLPKSAAEVIAQADGAFAQIEDPASFEVEDAEQKLSITKAEYRGRGAYSLWVTNKGNRAVPANRLQVRPLYYVANRPAVVGENATNTTPIAINAAGVISSEGGGIYAFGMAECSSLTKVVLEVKDPLTSEVLEHTLLPSRPSGEVVDVDMYFSGLTYTVKNTGAYTAKFKIRMLRFDLLKTKYESLATLEDMFHTSITLRAGETKSVSLPAEQVNAELKAKIPSLQNKFYGADHYMAELYTEYESDYCKHNAPIVVDQFSGRRHSVGAIEEILIR